MLKMGAGAGIYMSVLVVDYWYIGWVLYRILIIMFPSIPSLLPAERVLGVGRTMF